MVKLTVDGREVSVPKGTGVVEAALAAGIEIPVFCYEPRLGPPVGACRMCLCEVAPGSGIPGISIGPPPGPAARRLPHVSLRGGAGAAEAAGRLHAHRGGE